MKCQKSSAKAEAGVRTTSSIAVDIRPSVHLSGCSGYCADVHDIVVAQFPCEDVMAECSVPANIHASEENDESRIGLRLTCTAESLLLHPPAPAQAPRFSVPVQKSKSLQPQPQPRPSPCQAGV